MKTYKNIEAFKKRVQKSTDWDDYFMLNGRMFNIYEYGGGWKPSEPCYVYFLNKRGKELIKVEYYLPHTNYVNGEKVTTGKYECLKVEYDQNVNYLWR